MAKKLSMIAHLLEISSSIIYREAIVRGFDYDNYDANKAHCQRQETVVFCISYLPRNHRKRKRKVAQRKEVISSKQSIYSRDAVVEELSRIGGIEIDSVVGSFNQAGIITGTERKSRYNMARLVSNKTANETLVKLLEMLLVYKKKIKTITSDNGAEFVLHLAIIVSELNVQCYFADRYSSYQCGSNEHGNGMIQLYFPKGTDFSLVSEDELQLALYKINHLPRKIHNRKTAHEIFYGINKKFIPAKQRKILNFAFRT